MINHIGPAGSKGCVRFNCMKPAVMEFTYHIKFLGRNALEQDSRVRFCTGHLDEHIEQRQYHPWKTLIEEKKL